MSNLKKLLGLRIKEIRKSLNMTQEKLAELVGIGTPNISYIENGKFAPSVDTLEKMAKVMKVKPYEFYMFDHLDDIDSIKEELFNNLEQDDKLLRMMYKFYRSIK
mgnify:CR=1 FL=1